ncbi:hypothetical protein E5P55_00920 [Candidatus Pinguicoccus supinus]|uniref:50S ribosomal protein L22 n=1 Tax=Candidatus Pinguicoccus supinus TaxID=2529394 RepID=A0A7T0BRH8_9BACT|nr:hypothetical protein E5P55_00920 [Candidatus Pinguicoccus supinus]
MLKHFYFKYRYLRTSYKKVKFLSKSLIGLNIVQIKNLLNYFKNKNQFLILKCLKNCFQILKKKYIGLVNNYIYVSNILVQKGPSIKRFKFFSKGLIRPFLRRSSHLVFILSIIKK